MFFGSCFFNWLDVYQLYYNNFQKKNFKKGQNQLKCLRKAQNFYEKKYIHTYLG